MKEKIIKYTKEELKNMNGVTHWGILLKESKEPNKKIQRTQKTRR